MTIKIQYVDKTHRVKLTHFMNPHDGEQGKTEVGHVVSAGIKAGYSVVVEQCEDKPTAIIASSTIAVDPLEPKQNSL